MMTIVSNSLDKFAQQRAWRTIDVYALSFSFGEITLWPIEQTYPESVLVTVFASLADIWLKLDFIFLTTGHKVILNELAMAGRS